MGVALVLLLSGCFKDSPFENPDLSSLNVSYFALSSKEVPELKDTFFSIDHVQRKIYNAQPLPYGTQLGKVKLSMEMGAKVYSVLRGSKGDILRDSKDSIDLTGVWQSALQLEIKRDDNSQSRTYTVEINAYSFDPDTYRWQEASQKLPAHSNASSRYTIAGDNLYQVTPQGTGIALSKAQKETLLWQTVTVTGFPQSTLRQVVATANEHLAALVELTSGGLQLLYSADGGASWRSGSSLSNDALLLGAYVEPGKEKPYISLINDNKFVRWDATTEALTEGAKVPDNFPRQSLAHLEIKAAHHPLLLVMGVGKQGVSVWSTTTGLDWLLQKDPKGNSLPNHSDQITPCLLAFSPEEIWAVFPQELGAEGTMTIYSSRDRGFSWRKRSAGLILPPVSLMPYDRVRIWGFVDAQHTFYLLGGLNKNQEHSLSIWSGKALIYSAS